jgi:hypothetical protein
VEHATARQGGELETGHSLSLRRLELGADASHDELTTHADETYELSRR